MYIHAGCVVTVQKVFCTLLIPGCKKKTNPKKQKPTANSSSEELNIYGAQQGRKWVPIQESILSRA